MLDIQEGGSMTWNYRVVHFKNPEFEEDDYYEIKEVFYSSATGKPMGYSDAVIGANTYNELFKVASMMQSAHAKPVLTEEDFNTKQAEYKESE